MKKEARPIRSKQQKVINSVNAAIKEVYGDQGKVNFTNTEIAFKSKSNKELKNARNLFTMMSKPWLVNIGSKLGLLAIKLRLPFVETIVRKTLFRQFVGGRTLLETQPAIDTLYKQRVITVLDYGAEAKDSEEEYNKTMNEIIRAIDFAAPNESVPIVTTKITGMARFDLLESISKGVPFTKESRKEYKTVLKRIDSICHVAKEKGVGIFIDAEESWIQAAVDQIVDVMMRRYNKEKAVVYNTFQMYRKDRLQFLVDSYDNAQKAGYILGAKFVRGAYMEKERERAEEMNYSSPIHVNKAATDDAFNQAVRFCVNNYEKISFCNASHNAESQQLQARLIVEKGIPKDHPHLNFCQLYGMSDHLTFNLAAEGYTAGKYVPYGSVKEVVPYLVRRAQENTSVTGDMGRELSLINQELKRRGL